MKKRLLIALAVLAVAYEVISVLVDSFTPGPGGATSSSYATSSDGLAAYAQLLQRSGHRVAQLRGAPAGAQLQPTETVIALDPNRLTSGDTGRLKAFVEGGGELVAGGASPTRWLGKLLRDPPSWQSIGSLNARPSSPSSELQGIRSVRSAGNGSFTSAGQSQPVLGADGASLMTTARLGRGRIDLLADASPLQNSYLDQADNAALGYRLAGGQGRPVAFLEGIHGYGTGTGLAGLPARWKWALVALLLAALAWVAARFRRLGAPQLPASAPVPPRRAHVEALALSLERTRQPSAAAEPVVSHAREIVLRRAMLEPDADRDAIITAAQRLGLDEAEARAVAGEAGSGTDDDLLAAGRALARLT